MPDTIPVNDPINAIAGALLIQVPPVTVSVSNAEASAQTDNAPDIGAGKPITVTDFTAEQPDGTV
jgi:hypothetical protein